jgi:hypothetical protein
MPVPSDYSYAHQTSTTGYETSYPPSDYQSVRTPPGSPGQRYTSHNRPLSGQFYPTSPSNQHFQQTDTSSIYSNDQVSSRFDRSSLDQRPPPPALPMHDSYTNTTLSSSSSQRHHHPLPETPANMGEKKTLPHPPPPEIPPKHTETKGLPQPPPSPFALPEKDPHYHHRAAPPTPIVIASVATPQAPVKTYHLSRDDDVDSPPDSPIFQKVAKTTAYAMQGNNYAFLSVLSRAFTAKIRALEHVRELFCAFEYPESFTGQEAVVSGWRELGEKGKFVFICLNLPAIYV